MTDQELDFSGFQAERKVDVPPPSKEKTPGKSRAEGKKGKKKKKKETAQEAHSPEAEVGEPVPQPEPAKPRSAASARKGAPTRGRKKRVNISLPVDLSQRFTKKADEEDRYLTDMVLDAYRKHYAEMRDEYMAERGDADLPFRPRRRKATTGRVTHMLYLAAPEIAVIDGSAVEVNISRSELVSQLLERELG